MLPVPLAWFPLPPHRVAGKGDGKMPQVILIENTTPDAPGLYESLLEALCRLLEA